MTKVTPKIAMIDGMATWDENTVLVTDYLNGKVYKPDALPGRHQRPQGASHGSTFTTPPRPGTRCTARPSHKSWSLQVPWRRFASGVVPDDMVVARDGTTVYVCTNVTNTVARISPDGGDVVTVAGEAKAMTLAGSTACVFGQGERVLYVATAGGNATPVEVRLD